MRRWAILWAVLTGGLAVTELAKLDGAWGFAIGSLSAGIVVGITARAELQPGYRSWLDEDRQERRRLRLMGESSSWANTTGTDTPTAGWTGPRATGRR